MDGKNSDQIGPLLKVERRKAGLSQDDVSLTSGITQATISHLESGDLLTISTFPPHLLNVQILFS